MKKKKKAHIYEISIIYALRNELAAQVAPL